MGTNNVIFLEVIEWFDESGKELVHRIPEKGSGEIKWGAQLTVRESQNAVFFYNGQAHDTFSPGRHTFETANLPILNKLMSIPWGMTSPLRAEVYICHMKVFPNLTWGTRDPVAFHDKELGLIRLRAFGMFNMQIADPRLFINSLVGTQGIYTTDEISEYLNRVIVSRFNDFMGEKLDTIFNLPARYNELSEKLKGLITTEFSQYGLKLLELFINSITPPPDVQKAIDDKSKLGVFDDMNKLLKMKAAMALEDAAQNPGQAGTGLGMGVGVMMPGMIADAFKTQTPQAAPAAGIVCPSCRQTAPAGSKFCPSCGKTIASSLRCGKCGTDLPAGSKFCTQCGQPTI
jgi:membrane protease subunit (stomatin/prohibitin family)